MVLDKESTDTTPTATDSGSVAPPSHPRKRRRKTTESIPDTAPARRTRSQTTATRTGLQPSPSSQPAPSQPAPSQPMPMPLPLVHSPARRTERAKKIQTVTKPASQVYRYLPREMPDDLGGLPVRLSIDLSKIAADTVFSLDRDIPSHTYTMGFSRRQGSATRPPG